MQTRFKVGDIVRSADTGVLTDFRAEVVGFEFDVVRGGKDGVICAGTIDSRGRWRDHYVRALVVLMFPDGTHRSMDPGFLALAEDHT